MRVRKITTIGSDHRDYEVLTTLEAALIKGGKGMARIRKEVPQLIRRAIDEVIDAPRSGRLTFDQVEKTEKTYLGTKIEIFLRKFFGFPKGLLDLRIDGHDVDIKNTVGENWMIPTEAIEKACILVASDEKKALCQLGLVVCHREYLTQGQNKDSKKSISAEGFAHILWLLKDQPYPPNFWEKLDPQVVKRIMAPDSATQKVVQLFREVQKMPISRNVILAIAPQNDSLKRLRKNGGARDTLMKEGIAVLSGVYDAPLAKKLGLPLLGREEFMGVHANTPELERILRAAGKL